MNEMAESTALASDPKKLSSKLDEILAHSEVLLGKLPTKSTADDSTLTQFEMWDKDIEWLTSLWQNRLNGILADHLGFGTVEPTTLFLDRLKEKGLHGPYLIITSDGGIAEWSRAIRDVRLKDLFYFGVKKDRTKMRKEFMHKTVGPDFPIILTTYWMAMTDEQRLPHCEWKYVVVDEGRELKKWEFELLDKLKGLPMDHKLLLIRSPFQNNLAEMWSRLNFVLPRMFSSREEFDSWFDFSGKEDEEQQHEEEKRALLSKLHAILRPFLRRQMEEDIENRVPHKKDIKNRVPQNKYIENRVPQKKVVTCYRNLFPSDNLLSSQYGLEGNVVKRPRTNGAPRPTSTLEECNNSFQAPSKPAVLVLVQVPNSTSSELVFKSLKEIPELARSDILRAYSALVRDDRQFESLMALPMDMRKDWLLMETGNK